MCLNCLTICFNDGLNDGWMDWWMIDWMMDWLMNDGLIDKWWIDDWLTNDGLIDWWMKKQSHAQRNESSIQDWDEELISSRRSVT